MSPALIPTDEPSVFDVLKSLTTLQKQAIVRPQNPPPGIAGFLFDIVGDESIELTSDITDHYAEDNDALNDQIANAPERVMTRGNVAEIASYVPPPQSVAPQTAALPPVPAFLPVLSPGGAERLSDAEATKISAALAVSSSPSLWSYFNDQSAQQPNQTKQARAFLYFYNLWKGRQLFTVETPYGFMANCAIQTFRAEQSEESKFESAFTLVFKKMRFVGTAVVTPGQLDGRAAFQSAPVTQNGNLGTTQQTAEQEQSLLYRMTHPSP